jgi:hypothetical protein
MTTDNTFNFDVALSFAGEDRLFVKRVASILRESKIRVFYDEDEEISLWGKDLGDELDEIYRLRSRYVILFISHHYANKMWTNHERKSALARAIQEKSEYVLPARFDDTELAGLRPTLKYIDLRGETPEAFASKIIKKISPVPSDQRSLSAISSEDLLAAPNEPQAVLGYGILGVDKDEFFMFWDLFGDPPPQNQSHDSEFEEVYFDNFTEMNEVAGALKRIMAKANEAETAGLDRQKTFERALFEEGISRAGRYAISSHNQRAPDPGIKIPGLKYIIWGVRKGHARMIKVLRPHEITKDKPSINRDAHEVYFKNIDIVPQIPAVIAKAVKDSNNDNQEFLRLLFEGAMRLRTFGPDSESR